LTLPAIVRRFASENLGRFERDMALAQATLAAAGRERLRELEADFTSVAEWEAAGLLIGALDRQIASANMALDGAREAGAAPPADVERRLRLAVCEAERAALDALLRGGAIGDKAFRYTQYGIDLAESLFRGSG
jgi:hypothetical protein